MNMDSDMAVLMAVAMGGDKEEMKEREEWKVHGYQVHIRVLLPREGTCL